MKQCQVCLKEIPDDYVNLLCIECYKKDEEERKLKLTQEEEERAGARQNTPEDQKTPQNATESPTEPIKGGVKDPNYQENPEQDDKPQWTANIVQFSKSGTILWKATRTMYEYVKDYCMKKALDHPQYPKYVWKPTIVDVGCGCGVGSNILSQEADFVWGIDKNKESVKFAQECFTRQKNGIYYNSQVTFDNIDIIKDDREMMVFDIVVAIEIIEHIDDYKTFLKNIIRFAKQKKGSYNVESGPTEFFISTPNRNNRHIRQDKPYNKYHVREWTQEEFIDVLSKFFENIEIMDSLGRPVGDKKDHTPLLAKCSLPKI